MAVPLAPLGVGAVTETTRPSGLLYPVAEVAFHDSLPPDAQEAACLVPVASPPG